MKLENVILEPDTIANQPDATDVPIGTIYCQTDSTPANTLQRSNGTTWEDFAPTTATATTASKMLALAATQNSISNDNTEQTLYTYTVAGNTLGTGNYIRLKLDGHWINNTGSGRTVRLRVLFGGVAVYDDVSLSLGTNTQTFPWMLDLRLANRGATNSQILAGTIMIGAYGTAAPDVGIGAIQQDVGGATSYVTGLIQGTGAIDTTSSAALAVLVTLSTASSSLTITRELTVVELIAP